MTIFYIIEISAWIIVALIIGLIVFKHSADFGDDVETAAKQFADAGLYLEDKPSYPLINSREMSVKLKKFMDTQYAIAYSETLEWNNNFPNMRIEKRPNFEKNRTQMQIEAKKLIDAVLCKKPTREIERLAELASIGEI